MLLTACSCTAGEPPWWVAWIPLIAALAGIAGVWVGAWMAGRNDLRRWRLQQRNQALLLFAERADAYRNTVTRYFAPLAAGPVTAGTLLDALLALDGAGTLVQMQSPLAIRNAVEALMNHVSNNILPATGPAAPALTQQEQQALLNTFVARLSDVVDAARKDFGVKK